MENYKVKKRNGEIEDFSFDKILLHLKEATKDYKNVDVNDIIANFKIGMKEEMDAKDIQKTLIQTVAQMIDKEHSEYQYVSARLLLQDLYKDIYGSYKPVFNSKIINNRIKDGIYDEEIWLYYTKEEVDELCKVIDFKNDLKFTYSGLTQMTKKYANKRNGKPIETPQEVFFLIALYNFKMVKNKRERESLVKNTYKSLANFELFLSTPPTIGIRTKMKGYTSCAGVNWGDSIESFGNAMKTTIKLITKLRAGIGSNMSFIRGLGADIGNGFEKHTGITPYVKVNESITMSSTQPNSGRSGKATNYYPFFHFEIESILELKNNKGADEQRARQSDHAIVFDDIIYERFQNGKDITLFHINEVPELVELIGTDKFKEKYEEYERKRSINKRKIPAESLLKKYYTERYQTARIYKVNAEEMQRHGTFKIPNYVSNLCLEINLPSFPDEDFTFNVKNKKQMKDFIDNLYKKGLWYQLYRFIQYNIIDENNKKILKEFNELLDINGKPFTINFGETFSCILGGINIGILPLNKEDRLKKVEKLMNLMVRFLDEMIEQQDYAGIKSFEKFTKNRRALGISPGNMFYLLARANYDYNTQEARNLMHEIMEEMMYFGLKASTGLAKQKGKCYLFNDTKYSDGILPIDTYNKNVDKFITKDLTLDWETLREDIKKYGLRNSTLLTAVPSSNSSRPANMISGINPPQTLEPTIEDNRVKVKSLLPDVEKYEEFYKRNSAWNLDVLEYWKLIAVLQKFIDQAISLNEYVDYSKYPSKQIPFEEVLKRDLFMEKYGIKTLYYAKSKTQDEDGMEDIEVGCSGGGCTL